MSYKKQPKYASIQEYIEIDSHNKKHHPIQYFFRESIPDYFDLMQYRIKSFVWGMIRRFIPRYNYSKCPTDLDPRKYYDIVDLMVYVNFKFLERFVEDEGGFDIIDWYDDDHFDCEREFVYSELTDLYFWWKNVRQEQYKVKKEQYLDDQDTYNLVRLMKLRTWMWT